MSSGDLSDVYLALPFGTEAELANARALKLYLPEIANDAVFRRWLIEGGRVVPSVRDDCAVTVFEVGEVEGALFSVRELVQGAPFNSVLRRGRLEVGVASGVIGSLAASLRRLRTQGVPPLRTITPRHIMLTDSGAVRLLGIELAFARPALQPKTGSLAHTAPEALAHKESAEPAEVFALGTVLYEALTGRAAFSRLNDAATRQAIETGDLEDARMSEVQPEVRALVLSMLALDPSARPRLDEVEASLLPHTVREFEQSIRSVLATTMTLERQAQKRIIEAALSRAKKAKLRASLPPPRPLPIGVVSPERRKDIAEEVTQPGLKLDAETMQRISNQRIRSGEETTEVSAPKDVPVPQPQTPAKASTPVRPVTVVPIPAVRSIRPSVEPSPVPKPPEEEPTVRKLGRYELIAEISGSRETVIFLARDPHVNRKVALKVLDVRSEPDPKRLALLQREARILGALRHQRVPALLDAGRDGPFFYLVSSYIEGQPLAQHLEPERRLSSDRVRVILRDLSEALLHMHEFGIAHGDVRTSNVLVGEDGHAFLLDLSMGEVATEPPHPDRESNFSASAPETMISGSYTTKSDQFVLGALAYRLLIGEPPFLASGRSGMKLALTEHQPRPLLERRPEIDPSLAAVVMRLLEKDPDRRYASLSEVLSLLAPRAIDENFEEQENYFDGFVELLDRASALVPLETAVSARPALLAKEISRRLAAGLIVERRAAAAAALLGLTDRVAGGDTERTVLTSLAPPSVRNVMIEVAKALAGDVQPLSLPAEIAFVAVQYSRALRPPADGKRASPRTAVLDLRQLSLDGVIGADTVEALVTHLRDVISALDVPDRAPPPPRVLLVGESPLSPELEERLRIAGYLLARFREGSSPKWDVAIVDGSSAVDMVPRLARRPEGESRGVVIVTRAGSDPVAHAAESFGALPLPETLLGALSRLLDR